MPEIKMPPPLSSECSRQDSPGLSSCSPPAFSPLLGLADAADHGGLQMYETASLGAWVHIDGGHTLEVHEGHRIFIKDVAVRDYQDFDLHHIGTRHGS